MHICIYIYIATSIGMSGIYCTSIDHLSNTYWIYIDHISNIYRVSIDHVSSIYRAFIDHVLVVHYSVHLCVSVRIAKRNQSAVNRSNIYLKGVGWSRQESRIEINLLPYSMDSMFVVPMPNSMIYGI